MTRPRLETDTVIAVYRARGFVPARTATPFPADSRVRLAGEDFTGTVLGAFELRDDMGFPVHVVLWDDGVHGVFPASWLRRL